jgi:hypothetical protein
MNPTVTSAPNNYAWPTMSAGTSGWASQGAAPQWTTSQPMALPFSKTDTVMKHQEQEPPQAESISEKQPAEEKESSTLSTAWKKTILFAPILGFIASSALITKSLPKGLKQKLVNGTLKAAGRTPLPIDKIDNGLKNFGQKFLGFAVLLKSLGGISAGIVSGQPSMIWGNLIQIIPSGILAFKKSNAMQNLATSMEMLLGGFYTIGFANELKNKDPKTSPDQIRKYDMTHLKSLFDRKNDLTVEKRLTGLLGELGHMAAFTIEDHILLVKDLGQKAIQAFSKKEASPDEPQPTFKSKLEQWTKEPSASKSQLAVLFFYLGTLPILLLTRKNPQIGEKRFIIALKAIGMAIANLAPFAIAFNRDDLRGKAPLIGAPMAVIGMANSRNPFFVGMGHLGESFNDLFFSDVAVNGVKTKSDSTPTSTPAPVK